MKLKLLFLLLLIFGSVSNSSAQNKALEKALKKEYKTKMKEYKKEGWKIFGTTKSLDVALLLHYDKILLTYILCVNILSVNLTKKYNFR